ncbi:MAG: hypothetical protein ACYSOI_09355 [Planctomycetota bacterium]|jgi:hypothetical protein
MKLPEVKNADKYTGLYVVDFSDHCGVGFVADEVAELLESEQFANVQVYKVHRANPDGTMELKGVNKEVFQLEAGMFFHAADETTARADFQRLTAWADEQLPPARCKVHLAGSGDSFITALIYPAECYYDAAAEIIERKNLWPASSVDYLHGEALMEATNRAIVR